MQVVNEYTDWERTSQHPINTRDAAVAALSDAQFVAPLVHTGDLLAPPPALPGQEKTGPKCFFCVFDYQTKDGDYPQVVSEHFFFIYICLFENQVVVLLFVSLFCIIIIINNNM